MYGRSKNSLGTSVAAICSTPTKEGSVKNLGKKHHSLGNTVFTTRGTQSIHSKSPLLEIDFNEVVCNFRVHHATDTKVGPPAHLPRPDQAAIDLLRHVYFPGRQWFQGRLRAMSLSTINMDFQHSFIEKMRLARTIRWTKLVDPFGEVQHPILDRC